MYLHFEDWSEAPSVDIRLAALGLPHEGRVIKVFASAEDLRLSLGRSALVVMEAGHEPFADDEVYGYAQRRAYSGSELEEDLGRFGLDDGAADIMRSLFRFSNEYGFCQAAMALKRGSTWAIRHPFQSIDGAETARKKPDRVAAIHLDIFLPDSLRILESMVDFEETGTVLDWREGIRRFKT